VCHYVVGDVHIVFVTGILWWSFLDWIMILRYYTMTLVFCFFIRLMAT